jgi:DNA transformation protein
VSLREGWRDYVLEQLAGVKGVSARSMFGGAGLYCGGAIFGVMDDDQVFFKVDDATRPLYVARGAKPWEPMPGREKPSRGYYEVPGDVLDDRDELCEWARRAIEVAGRAKRAKKK